jgi:hypothetical protein
VSVGARRDWLAGVRRGARDGVSDGAREQEPNEGVPVEVGPGERTRAAGPKAARTLLPAYLAVQIGLFVASAVLPVVEFVAALIVTAVLLGGITFMLGIAVRRPEPPAGWWMVAGSTLLQVVAGIAALALTGVAGGELEISHASRPSSPSPRRCSLPGSPGWAADPLRAP